MESREHPSLPDSAAAQPVGVDRDPSRRPGVPRERRPAPWPHTHFPPARMEAQPSVPKHGRPNKQMPPVYGTAVPLRGLSGRLRARAYRIPDHEARHWALLLLADRVDIYEHGSRKAVPLVILGCLLLAAGVGAYRAWRR